MFNYLSEASLTPSSHKTYQVRRLFKSSSEIRLSVNRENAVSLSIHKCIRAVYMTSPSTYQVTIVKSALAKVPRFSMGPGSPRPTHHLPPHLQPASRRTSWNIRLSQCFQFVIKSTLTFSLFGSHINFI